MLRHFRDLVEAENGGQTFVSAWRKTPSQATGAGIWFDLSMSPGNPNPNYYAAAPNIAIALGQGADGGIPHGPATPAGMTKYLKMLTVMTGTAAAVPMSMILCDYLMFYPFVDMSVTDQQDMVNNVTLPRYPDGKGVQIMAVEVAGQSGIGNPRFFLTYTNSDGVPGRTTPAVACNTQTVNGTLINTMPVGVASINRATSPFLPLQPGDTGVRSIQSVTFLAPDVGLIAFVLVCPLETIALRGIDAPVERVPVLDFSHLPAIKDDAYLNMICCPNGSLSGAPIHGLIQTVWS